jgi:hypothetical protein
MIRNVIVCESTAAITLHLRAIDGPTDRLVNYGGHAQPRPKALCGVEVAWDTHLPKDAARCGPCRTALYKAALELLKDD